MLHRPQRFRGNVLGSLHRGTQGSPQDVYRSVYVPVVVRTTIRTRPLPIRERKVFVVETTITTRFCCRRPLTDLKQLTLMFETLELQYLNKLVKGKIGDLPSPQAFHTLKIQRFGDDGIKAFTQVGSNLVVPVLTLVGDMPIQPRKSSDTPPPIVRTLNFARKTFVEGSQFFQRAFEKLWRVFLFAGAKCQVGFHSEVYPYALTCSRTGFGCRSICNHVKPIRPNTISKDLDIANFTVRVAMLMEREPTFVELQALLTVVPRFERKSNTPFFKKVRRLELRRTIAVFAFELWKSTQSGKASLIGGVDTDNHSVKRITRYPCPLPMRPFEQLRQVRLKAVPTGILTVNAVIALLKFEEVIVNIPQVVEHVPQAHILWMFAYLVFIRSAMLFLFFPFSHGVSRITSLTPVLWVGPTRYQAVTQYMSVQRDTFIKPQFG